MTQDADLMDVYRRYRLEPLTSYYEQKARWHAVRKKRRTLLQLVVLLLSAVAAVAVISLGYLGSIIAAAALVGVLAAGRVAISYGRTDRSQADYLHHLATELRTAAKEAVAIASYGTSSDGEAAKLVLRVERLISPRTAPLDY